MFQKSGLIYADEMIVHDTSIDDVDIEYFKAYFEKRFKESPESKRIPLEQILENMHLMKDGKLTVSGALLFAKQPFFGLPLFIVKAGAFDAYDIKTDNYQDSRDLTGNLEDICKQTVWFITSHLHHVQKEQSFNSVGIPEIPLGNSIARNPILATHASHLLPYRGYGSGIISALAKYPHIDFIDDRDSNIFKAVLKRGLHNGI